MNYREELEQRVRDGKLNPAAIPLLLKLRRDSRAATTRLYVRLVIGLVFIATIVKVWFW